MLLPVSLHVAGDSRDIPAHLLPLIPGDVVAHSATFRHQALCSQPHEPHAQARVWAELPWDQRAAESGVST